MDLAGTLVENLQAAIFSARRLSRHYVHPDTLRFWQELLHHARLKARRPGLAEVDEVHRLIAQLQSELAAREIGSVTGANRKSGQA